MKHFIKVEIKIDENYESKCGSKRSDGFCPQLEKKRGTYHCTIFEQEVDNGDDETGDYLFLRCDECIKQANHE